MPLGALLKKALDNANEKTKNPTSTEYLNFLRSKEYLVRKGWHQSSDGGCGIGGVFSIKSMYSFNRIPHTYENQRHKHETPETTELAARREHIRTHPKIQQPGSKLGSGPDFDDIKECNGSLSFLGIVSFLRDFDFVPRYVLSDDLLNLWRAQGVARKTLLGHSNELKRSAPVGTMAFQEFIEFLCKVALLAFPERTPLKAIDKLRRKLFLEDESVVRRIIEERGGPSCYRINYPSNAEDAKLLTRELLEESHFKYGEVRQHARRAEDSLIKPRTTPSDQEQVKFCIEHRNTSEWRRRYSELVDQQSLIPTHSIDFSSLMLNKKLLDTLATYDVVHLEALQPFVFAVRRSWAALEVPALDLGVLHVGKAYSLQLLVKNTFSTPLAFKVPQLRGSKLRSNMRHFTMDATTTICPGLTFNIVMEIDPVLDKGRETQDVYGAIELDMFKETTILNHTKTANDKPHRPPTLEKYCIPVYFQISYPPR